MCLEAGATMKGMVAFALSLFVGYLAHEVMTYAVAARAVESSLQAQTAAPADPNALPPGIPPVADPPLYPDVQNHQPMYWSAEQMHEYFVRRSEWAKAHPSAPFFAPVILPPDAPRLQGDVYRTHTIGVTSFRRKFLTPQPSNMTGRLSLVDDADQHQGVSDFYVMTGGVGVTILGGVITDREYAPNPPGFINRPNMRAILPGEFSGQPVLGGTKFETKEGDWFLIPPNVPHWWDPGPDGMGYLVVKIDIGWYPHDLHM
jgi:hypothetical protein